MGTCRWKRSADKNLFIRLYARGLQLHGQVLQSSDAHPSGMNSNHIGLLWACKKNEAPVVLPVYSPVIPLPQVEEEILLGSIHVLGQHGRVI